MLFGKRIKELRESQKLPQRVVADALEITIPLYSRVERGERTLSKSHLPKLAQVLNVEENELLKLYLADQVALVLDGQLELYDDVLDIAKRDIIQMKPKQPTVLDLFCGCGGLSRGFIDAGFSVKLGVDFDDKALESFAHNHEDAVAMKLDLFNLDNVEQIKQFFTENGYELDVLVGGPPCQGFSLAGPRQVDDSRNVLYQAMVKTATMMKPKVVVLENVPGMVQLHGGLVAEKIISDFTKLGYKMGYKILYAPDYGIPQIRKRVVFVGLLGAKEYFHYPEPTCQPENYVTCEEAIGDLPCLLNIEGDIVQQYETEPQSKYQEDRRKGSSAIHNHIGTIHDEKTKKFIAMVPEGKNYKSLPPEYAGIYKYHEALTRYHSKKPSPTINTGHRSHFHYKWDRIPTVRESARLQSFDDTFIFYGNKTQQYRQVGNAVPPLLGKAIAGEIKKWLDDKHSTRKKKNGSK